MFVAELKPILTQEKRKFYTDKIHVHIINQQVFKQVHSRKKIVYSVR